MLSKGAPGVCARSVAHIRNAVFAMEQACRNNLPAKFFAWLVVNTSMVSFAFRGRSPAGGSRSIPQLMNYVRLNPMRRISSLVIVVAVLVAAALEADAAPLNKCVVNGTVTYQQGLCPATQPRKDPTLEELNAAEKKKRAAAASAATGAQPQAAPQRAAPSGRFSCDGRQYCSQMRSCDEARYFLANCPDPRLDGDGNGIPCEKQWCGR